MSVYPGGRARNWKEEEAELSAVLKSPPFARAPNLCSVLTFVCERLFRDEADSIKEYSVGVGALNRGPSFDPSRDSIVRVEASRLRKRLAQYYSTEGVDHPIRIEVPEGGYVPRFVRSAWASVSDSALAGESPNGAGDGSWKTIPAAGQPRFSVRGLVLLFVVAFVIVVLLGLMNLQGRRFVPTAVTNGAFRPQASPSSVTEGSEIRIRAGFLGSRHMDPLGRVWHSDRYFTGGAILSRPNRRIYRTLDQALYETARVGDFRYDIPLKPGVYELHLYFAETLYGSGLESDGTGDRRFSVSIGHRALLDNFDIVPDAGGPDIADERVFKDVSPGPDGFLHLNFAGKKNKALVSGIEILPGLPGRMRPVRIVANSQSVYDERGELWGADRFFRGGALSKTWRSIQGAPSTQLYNSERYGHFTYAIPVADGTYSLRLQFAETSLGPANPLKGGVGDRVFDIYCNGIALLENFDVIKEARGENRVADRVFLNLKANAQSKLLLSFVPSGGKIWAFVNAIEVTDERP